MLVLTDGNENVEPYVEDLPAGTITNRTYAIGFGLPGGVSDMVLNQITQNTDGDLIITGELTSLDEQFLLTKYFVQILAGVTSANIVLDPGGSLTWGAEHTIAFEVAGTDLELDVIELSAAPGLIEFWLETPTGAVIVPGDAASLPNVDYRVAENLAFYRVKLPALPGAPEKSHAGKWTAHLKLASREKIKKLLSSNDDILGELSDILRNGTLPYHVVVHARSNLNFAASLRQNSLEPGATLALAASLREYGVAYYGVAEVRAQVTRPDGSQFDLVLAQDEPGGYVASFTAKSAGIYQVRIRASGGTSGGDAFTREKTMTATIFAGGDTPRVDPRSDGGSGSDREFYCRLLDCLLRDDGVRHWLKRQELDAEALHKCLKSACRVARPTSSAVSAQPGAAATELDLARVLTVVRRELLAIDPENILDRAIEPVVLYPPEAAVAEFAVKDRAEPYAMPPEAAELIKEKPKAARKPRKKK
jgi:hypothetical protein